MGALRAEAEACLPGSRPRSSARPFSACVGDAAVLHVWMCEGRRPRAHPRRDTGRV